MKLTSIATLFAVVGTTSAQNFLEFSHPSLAGQAAEGAQVDESKSTDEMLGAEESAANSTSGANTTLPLTQDTTKSDA